MENLGKRGTDQPGFLDRQSRYVVKFMLTHRPELRMLEAGGILGRESARWRNVTEHCLVAGMMVHTLGRALDISENDLSEVTSVALTHDWDKRIALQAARVGELQEAGVTTIQYNVGEYLKREREKTGLSRVTGNDWRDYPTWGIGEKILRYVDSSVGMLRDESGVNGPEAILNWRNRINDLEIRHPGINQQEGERLYGIPVYTRLAQIMEQLEKEFHEAIIASRPDLGLEYPTPERLNDLIIGLLVEDIMRE